MDIKNNIRIFTLLKTKKLIKKKPEYDEVIAYDNPKVVEEMEKQWPEMTAEFKRIMFTQYELFCLKQSNYGPDNISNWLKRIYIPLTKNLCSKIVSNSIEPLLVH